MFFNISGFFFQETKYKFIISLKFVWLVKQAFLVPILPCMIASVTRHHDFCLPDAQFILANLSLSGQRVDAKHHGFQSQSGQWLGIHEFHITLSWVHKWVRTLSPYHAISSSTQCTVQCTLCNWDYDWDCSTLFIIIRSIHDACSQYTLSWPIKSNYPVIFIFKGEGLNCSVGVSLKWLR